MKQYKVIAVVVLMLCFSLATFVSQGEELAVEIPANQEDDITGPTNTSRQPNMLTARQVDASELSESTIKPIPPVQGPVFSSDGEEAGHHEDISFEVIPEPIDPRLMQIVEATPLDKETAGIILEYADRFDLRVAFILGVIDLESNFNQYLVGTSQDRGYMQIIPGTEKWLAEAYGEELGLTYNTSRIFDENYNLPLGMKYFSVLKESYGDETKMLTAYNRGDYGMEKWYEAKGTYETTYSRVVLKRAAKYAYIK